MCDNWKDAANFFEIWLKENHPDFLKRKDNDDCIIFSDNQESVGFYPFSVEVPKFAEGVVRTLLL